MLRTMVWNWGYIPLICWMLLHGYAFQGPRVSGDVSWCLKLLLGLLWLWGLRGPILLCLLRDWSILGAVVKIICSGVFGVGLFRRRCGRSLLVPVPVPVLGGVLLFHCL